MVNVNVVTLDDNVDYMVMGIVKYNNYNYLFLTNKDDIEDFCIRKVVVENNEEFLETLDTEEEFDAVMNEYRKNYLKDSN